MEKKGGLASFDTLFHFPGLLQKIFLLLDNKSLRTARRVNREWYEFLRLHIWKSVRCRRILETRLADRWSGATPKTERIRCSTPIFDLKCDNNNIVCALESGEIHVYDRKTLQRKCVVPCEHKQKIDVTRSKTDLTSNVHGIQVNGDSRLVVSMVNGIINTFTIDDEGQLCQEWVFEGQPRAVNYIDAQGSWLLAGSPGKKIFLWSLEDGSMRKTIQLNNRVWTVQLAYPLAVTCSYRHARDGLGGLQIWKLDEENNEFVRTLRFDSVMNVRMDLERLVVFSDSKVYLVNVQTLQVDADQPTYQSVVIGSTDLGEDRSEAMCAILERDTLVSTQGQDGRDVVIADYWLGDAKETPMTLHGTWSILDLIFNPHTLASRLMRFLPDVFADMVLAIAFNIHGIARRRN